MTRVSTSVRALAACLVLLGTLIQSAQADDASRASRLHGNTIRFDLAAEPLVDALQTYGHTAQLSVMAQSQLLAGRISAPVNGDYPADEALRRLLAGTGLQATFLNDTEAVLLPAPAGQPQEVSTPILLAPILPAPILASTIDGATGDDEYSAYNAMVQTRLSQALCASAQTRPGSYRLVVQLRIGEAGSVVASKLIGSTGLPTRDAAIGRVVRALVLDAAPPAALPQPVTILLRPEGNGVSTDCSRFDAGG